MGEQYYKNFNLERFAFTYNQTSTINRLYARLNKADRGIRCLRQEEYIKMQEQTSELSEEVCFLWTDDLDHYAGICITGPLKGKIMLYHLADRLIIPAFFSINQFSDVAGELEDLKKREVFYQWRTHTYPYCWRQKQEEQVDKEIAIELLELLKHMQTNEILYEQYAVSACLIIPSDELGLLKPFLYDSNVRIQKTVCSVYQYHRYRQAIPWMQELLSCQPNHTLAFDIDTAIKEMSYYLRINRKVSSDGSYIKQASSIMRYAALTIEIENIAENKLEIIFTHSDQVRLEFTEAVRQGLLESAANVFDWAYPLIGARITVTKMTEHSSDSHEMDFKIAAAIAFRKAVKEAGVTREERFDESIV